MKQGKGRLWGEHICRECGQCITPNADGVTYWAYERMSSHYDDRAYYHRSCGRKVTKRRVETYERNMAELRAMQATQSAPSPRKAQKRGAR